MRKTKVLTLALTLVLSLVLLTSCKGDMNLENIEEGGVIQFGEYNEQPIDWRVLKVEEGKALLITDKVIYAGSYHSHDDGVTWEYSDTRQYLNESFYSARFTAQEKKYIAETELVNSDNPWYEEGVGGMNTNDRLFLLSIDEVLEYFGDSGQIANLPKDTSVFTLDDEYNSERVAHDLNGNISDWRLRSPGMGGGLVCRVIHDGTVSLIGRFAQHEVGVRPAMWLNLDA